MAVPNSHDGQTNTTTAQDAVDVPDSITRRIIPIGGVSVFNGDTDPRVITIQKLAGSTVRIIRRETVAVGATLSNHKQIILKNNTEKVQVLTDAKTTNDLPFDAAWYEQ